jgi:hypothetical protein
LELQERYGNKWSLISRQIPGRTDNQIKKRFISNLKRQLQIGSVIPTYGRTATVLMKNKNKKRELKTEEKSAPFYQ